MGASVGIAVGVGEVVGIAGSVATGGVATAESGSSFGVAARLASLVADIAARTAAAISGVGATAVDLVGAWVGSPAQEVAKKTKMARADTMIVRMELLIPWNTGGLLHWILRLQGTSFLGAPWSDTSQPRHITAFVPDPTDLPEYRPLRASGTINPNPEPVNWYRIC